MPSEQIVLPPLEGELADVWRRMQESLGSPDEVMLVFAVGALAQFVEAASTRDVIFRTNGTKATHLGLPIPGGLCEPFSINPAISTRL